MESDLKDLQIDRNKRRSDEPSRWAVRWIIGGILLFVLLGAGRFVYARLNQAVEVEIARARSSSSSAASGTQVILNATGYIIAAHKIEVASKVVGRVAWIGVEKGDKVKQGQVVVRLEDVEYRAQLQQARGNLNNLKARLEQDLNGSRPEEIAKAKADAEQARADLINAEVNLKRTRQLVAEGVAAKQTLDDAQARYDGQVARVASLDRAYDLVKIGPRKEEIAAIRGQIEQADGSVAYYENSLGDTLIHAPVTGTILERNVEKGEFVTTGFVGDKGAKGYVVSLADLNDLKVELDINQNDFAKLDSRQKGVIITDAYPDRKYKGAIDEISPEANRQKATVQVKVKVLNPDEYLRPEMNASVAFYTEAKEGEVSTPQKRLVVAPAGAVRDNVVFVVLDGKATRRTVKTSGTNAQGVLIESGLIGGEDLVVNPPADLKDGDRVRPKS